MIRTSYLVQGMVFSAATAFVMLAHNWPGSAVGAAIVFYSLAKYLSPTKYGDE